MAKLPAIPPAKKLLEKFTAIHCQSTKRDKDYSQTLSGVKETERKEMVKLLFDAEADVNAPEDDG